MTAPKENRDLTVFNYSLVDKDTKGKLIWLAGEFKRLGKTHAESGLEMGRVLSEGRELLDEDKSFRDWVPAECGCSVSTAYNYMNAYADFGECPTVGHIELSAMYALTNNKKAKKAALQIASKGQMVTQEMAKKLVKKHKGEDASKEAPGRKPQESDRWPPGSGKDKPAVDFGKCPNCTGAKWTEDDDGVSCAKCHHPHGEAVGDVDDDRIKTQRAKTRKTVEALMRAFDDLNLLEPRPAHAREAIRMCKELLAIAKTWK